MRALLKIKSLFESFERELKHSTFILSYEDYFSGIIVDGKSFIYLACREAKLSLVKYFIEERLLDFKVNSTVSKNLISII